MTQPTPEAAQPDREAHRQWRKKPVVIHAVQWSGSNVDEVLDFICAKAEARRVNVAGIQNGIAIDTLEGTMIANPGDWIIRGVKGEFYPCKPDIFEQTYEPAALAVSPLEAQAKPERTLPMLACICGVAFRADDNEMLLFHDSCPKERFINDKCPHCGVKAHFHICPHWNRVAAPSAGEQAAGQREDADLADLLLPKTGWMDSIDFDHELGHALGGNKIHPDEEDLRANHPCIVPLSDPGHYCYPKRVYVFDADAYDKVRALRGAGQPEGKS